MIRRTRIPALIATACLFAVGCASSSRSNDGPVRWVDPDTRPIAKPGVVEEFRNWDFVDHSLVYPIGKTLDLDWTGRRLGGVLGLGDGKQADNLNRLDEVPNSSWFTNRHFLHPMTAERIAVGPGSAHPDTSAQWEIVAGKFHGVSSGFTIRDVKGETFVLKFDTKAWPEMASSAEVISTKVLHAAGYNVPENSVVIFHPSRLKLGAKARVRNLDGSRRPMTAADIDSVLAKVNVRNDGFVRAMSSSFLKGEPIGPFRFHGRRHDDPNDRVDHEHRRELRGLNVISSWLNDADRRTSNTLDMFIRTGDTGFVRHYLIDMGSTLGSNSRIPHLPRYGPAYLFSTKHVLKKLVGLGAVTEPWERPVEIEHPTIGYFSNEHFNPGTWVTAYPNPAFAWCGDRDGYWGAKIVMSFSDQDVSAMVRTGKLSVPEAEAELIRLLIERRDMIGRYWFSRVCPLDRFRMDGNVLRFNDLGVDGGLYEAQDVEYRCRFPGSGGWQRLDGTVVRLPNGTSAGSVEIRRSLRGSGDLRVRVEVRAHEGELTVWSVHR